METQKMNDRDVLYSPGRQDECYTPAYAVKALLPHLPKGLIYWCPFDTLESEFVAQLSDSGYKVTWSHLFYGEDFYTYEPKHWDVLVSNPPFTNKAGIFRRALSFGKPFALLMTLTWLNDAGPKQVFGEAERDLQLLMFRERVRFKGLDKKITFSSAYYCCDLLRKQIMMDSLKRYGMV